MKVTLNTSVILANMPAQEQLSDESKLESWYVITQLKSIIAIGDKEVHAYLKDVNNNRRRIKLLDYDLYLDEGEFTVINSMDYTVLESAYGFSIGTDGYLFGLISGDHGYESTGIKVDDVTLKIWKLGVAALEAQQKNKL